MLRRAAGTLMGLGPQRSFCLTRTTSRWFCPSSIRRVAAYDPNIHRFSYSSSSHNVPIEKVVKHAADLLPHQAIIENFVHHNPLHHLESMNFRQALEHVRELESYMSPGERLFNLVDVDPRKRVNESLADLSSAMLDRGAAKWTPGFRDRGFLYFFASLEGLGMAPWRSHARKMARRILDHMEGNPGESKHTQLAESIIQENLEFFGVPPTEYENAIRSMLMELRGWGGMFDRMETHPNEAPPNCAVRLLDFCAVQSILSRSSMEALARQFGWNGREVPFGVWLSRAPTIRLPSPEDSAPSHESAIAYVDQNPERREALEAEFERAMLRAIGTTGQEGPLWNRPRPALQLYMCIDDREGSFRRHAEKVDPSGIETFGVAGFFGIPIRYKPVDGRDVMVLAPEGQDPTAVLVEGEDKTHCGEVQKFNRRRRSLARLSLWWENASFSAVGSLGLSSLFPFSLSRLMLMGFAPDVKQKLRERFTERVLPSPHTDFELPLAPEVAGTLLARTFKDIGTHTHFAPIVIVLGHGATSVNNPFAAAYNCGACCGRQGGPNARLLARLANDPSVREVLRRDHDIFIPDDTFFVGGMHNTTADTVEFYDLERLPESHSGHLAYAERVIDEARGANALERCHRFLLAGTVYTPEQALRHVRTRSTDLAEVRPELNHATNAAVVVGRRDLTKGRFLDRRVFLPTYDPYSDDDSGTNLEHVLGPALAVCSGINLEYLFSTIDAEHHGAGTKVPLNVVSNVGVMQGTSGDLRPGLPSQMTEMHSPVRALFVVDAPVARVEAVLERRKELRQLVQNEWVRCFVRDPYSGQFHRQAQGRWVPVPDSPHDATELAVPFHHHRNHGMGVARREAAIYWAATAGMVASCAWPIAQFGAEAMNPYGSLVALSGTALALPILAFSRRYLHGEFMFGRFSSLCVGLLLGFNLVATAPDLEHTMAGWSLFGFASTFLIGAYNDRPTVRNNATFAFAAYRISDFALLVAATFGGMHALASGHQNDQLVAAGLLVAALFKSSQFPLTALFIRSMEGPTPASALGYAGLSAHVGVVLLAGTMPFWYDFEWARLVLGGVGAYTALFGNLASKIRADRKGAIARATSSTLGLIFVTLAAGLPEVALVASLGHAAFRMIQILRAPNTITDSQNLRSALGRMPWPKQVPDWLYKLSWRLRRVDTDFHLLNVLHGISGKLHISNKKWKLTRMQQWALTGAAVVLAGAPFTPLSDYMDEWLMEMLPTHPFLASGVMIGHFGFSVLLTRFLFVRVLSSHRFRRHFDNTPAKK